MSEKIGCETSRFIGAEVDLTGVAQGGTGASSVPRVDALLFGEAPHRVVVSTRPMEAGKVLAQARILGVPARQIGRVGGERLTLKHPGGSVDLAVRELHDLWWNAIPRAME